MLSEPKVVKSAARALAVLEYFDDVQRASSEMEIARALSFPQSSASMLLHSMVVLGYLTYDYTSRTFLPTPRVTLLGSWLDVPFFRDGAVMELVHEVGRQTDQLVLLAVQDQLQVRYIHVVPPSNPTPLEIRPGAVRSLTRSGIGKLFLSIQPDEQVGKLVRRLNAEETVPEFRINLSTIISDVAEIRRCGYSLSNHQLMKPGARGVSILLPGVSSAQPIAIAVVGLTNDDFVPRAVQIVRDGIRHYLSLEPYGTG